MDDVSFTDDPDSVDWTVLAEICERAPLGKRNLRVLERAFRGSFARSFLWVNGALVGAARAISDGETHSTVFDVVLLPELQGQGLGRRLMEDLLAKLPRGQVLLVAVPGREEFYRKLGFRRLLTGYAWMADPSGWQAKGYFELEGL